MLQNERLLRWLVFLLSVNILKIFTALTCSLNNDMVIFFHIGVVMCGRFVCVYSCVFVCGYVCVCVLVYALVFLCVCECICLYVRIHMVCMRVYKAVHVSICGK